MDGIEERVRQDCNGFWLYEVKILPVEDWEPNEGWRISAISCIKDTLADMLGERVKEVEGW